MNNEKAKNRVEPACPLPSPLSSLPSPLRIGTRASALARRQAEWVAAQLKDRGIDVELVPIVTTGDSRQESLEEIGGTGVFTKELQRALLDRRIDLAVHSLKDLPTAAVPGVSLAAVPERGPVGDVLVSAGDCPDSCAAGDCPDFCASKNGTVPFNSANGASLDALPRGAAIATGSIRRAAQLRHFRGDLEIRPIRGNVDTRLRKLRDKSLGLDALVLAEAGLQRLGRADVITQAISLEIMLPAAGQGALGLEIRSDDEITRQIAMSLDHPPTHAAVTAERSVLAALEAGCSAPVAVLGQVEVDRLMLVARILAPDGSEKVEARQTGPAIEAESLGRQVAGALLAQGAGRWLLIRESQSDSLR
jgi:hydroxymethylbilane synthase